MSTHYDGPKTLTESGQVPATRVQNVDRATAPDPQAAASARHAFSAWRLRARNARCDSDAATPSNVR